VTWLIDGGAELLQSGDLALSLRLLTAPGREQEQQRFPVRPGHKSAHHSELIGRLGDQLPIAPQHDLGLLETEQQQARGHRCE